MTETLDNGQQTAVLPLTLADIQVLLQTELTVALIDVVRHDELTRALGNLATRAELEQRLAAWEGQQPDLDAEMTQQKAAIAVVEGLFHDIKSSLEGLNGRLDNYGQVIDARQEEVETLRADQQQTERDLRRVEDRVAQVRSQQRELRHDVFGTGEAHGPLAFAERVLAGIEGLATQIHSNYADLTARFAELEARQTTTEEQVIAHERFIAQRQALEQGVLARLKQVCSSRILWRLLLVLLGGGLALLEIVRQ